MGRKILTWYPAMKRLILWKLEIALMNRVLYIDWNMAQYGNRWRFVLGTRPYFPLFNEPYRQGKYWAWYPRGFERRGWTT